MKRAISFSEADNDNRLIKFYEGKLNAELSTWDNIQGPEELRVATKRMETLIDYVRGELKAIGKEDLLSSGYSMKNGRIKFHTYQMGEVA
ncbi:MAG: hypothetical protein AABX03_02240 [Nanoarchaeota archaeon]